VERCVECLDVRYMTKFKDDSERRTVKEDPRKAENVRTWRVLTTSGPPQFHRVSWFPFFRAPLKLVTQMFSARISVVETLLVTCCANATPNHSQDVAMMARTRVIS